MDNFCADCARSGRRGCCFRETIVLTQDDVRRIEEFIATSTQFYELCDLSTIQNDRVKRWAENDPAWLKLVSAENGKGRVLKRQPNDSCWFLGTDGCQLPMNVKPLVCRLYPYDIFSETCLPERPLQIDVNCPPELFEIADNVAELIGIQRSEAEMWHAQLYREINNESKK